MLSANQEPSKIKQITNSDMRTEAPSSLFHCLEPPHTSFSQPSRLTRLLYSIILILLRTVDRVRNQFPVSDTVTSQFISHDFPGFAAIVSYKAPEESLCSSTIPLGL